MHFSRSAMKSAWFHGWNPLDFIMKSAEFHEICWISSWNVADFMKFGGFHHEIWRISWIVDFLPLNPVFFIRSNTDIHERTRSTTECCIFGSFGSFQYRYMLNISPYHEIHQISWNPPDFMKSARFHEICRIPCMKSTGFHAWNLPNFMHEICQISSWNLPNFMHEIRRISPWNPPNFMHEIRRISWNPPDFMKFVPNEPRTHGPIFLLQKAHV